jgi:hypothetical protein
MTQTYANVGDVPLALAVFLSSDYYDHDHTPNTISATTLLKPLRQIVLPTRIPPGVAMPNLADMMNNRMGSAIHDGIEKAWITNHKPAMAALGYPARVIERVRINPTPEELTEDTIPIYLEQRLKRQMGKWIITGKFDFVGEGRVQDFKTTSVWTYKNQVNATKYTQQGSIYRWLNPTMIHQDEMDIHYIFTDWKGGMQKTDPSYPPRRFHKQSFPLMSLGETEQFIRTKVNLIDQHWATEEELLPLCDDEELWRSEPQFKYYKSGDTTKSRSTKNFDTRQEAVIFMTTNGNTGAIKEVPGQVMACKYCPAFAICSQKDALIASGDLLMG